MYANDMWYKMTGVPLGSDPGQWTKHLHPDDLDVTNSAIDLLQSGKSFSNITLRWLKDGKILYTSCSTVLDEDLT